MCVFGCVCVWVCVREREGKGEDTFMCPTSTHNSKDLESSDAFITMLPSGNASHIALLLFRSTTTREDLTENVERIQTITLLLLLTCHPKLPHISGLSLHYCY